jgi:alkylhydroperoxidase family enzyme
MARISFPDTHTGPAAEIAAAVSAQRHGTLPNLYRMLLHSPAVAEGWLGIGTAVRYRSSLDDLLRELVICTVARVCESDYEWAHHSPLARSFGAGELQLRLLPDEVEVGPFTPAQAVALRHAAAVSRLEVDDSMHAALEEHFNATHIVELTATAAYYAGVARFLAALQVDIDAELA